MVPFRESEPLGPRMTNVLRGNANKHRILDIKMVPFRGVEPPTHALRMRCSTN